MEKSQKSKNTWTGSKVFLTINNYSDEHIQRLNSWLNGKTIVHMSCQTEVGEKGTPHIQGYIAAAKSMKDWHKQLPGAHFEKPDNVFACSNYCQKNDATYDGKHRWLKSVPKESKGVKRPRDPDEILDEVGERAVKQRLEEYKDVVWRDWQQELIDIINGPVDRRTIHWYYESNGNVGKSFLTNYLNDSGKAWMVNGIGADLSCLLAQQIVSFPDATILVLDVPRGQGNRICYTKLEEISNGKITSTKYKSRIINIPRVHKIVFANCEPNYEMMSNDRFKVRLIGQENEDVDMFI